MEAFEIASNKSLARQALFQANVRIMVEHVAKHELEFEFDGPLAEIAWPLVTKFPHIEWHVKTRKTGNSKVFRVSEFIAHKEGKRVGTVGTTYSRAYASAFLLSSNDIAEVRQRGNSLRTTKHNVVLSAVKKKFNPVSATKMIQEAMVKVMSVLNQEHWAVGRKVDTSKLAMSDSIFSRMLTQPQIADAIAPYVEESDMEVYQESQLAMRSIEDLREMVATANKSTALILLDRGGYIVRSEEHVAIYNDDTLPMEMRRSLGLLKLMQEDDSYMPNVGVRVNGHTFLVLVDSA